MNLTRRGVISRLVMVPVTVQAALLAAGCAVSGHAVAPASPVVSARLVLASTTIAAGSSVSARLVIDNPTRRAVHLWDCDLFQVVLQDPGYHPSPLWPACGRWDSIPPGMSVRKTTVMATVDACAMAVPTSPGLVPCGRGGSLPALPPGTYHAHVLFAVPRLASAPDVIVRVVPAAR
jgi:hypothetical protein